jgi:hypothetical protein
MEHLFAGLTEQEQVESVTCPLPGCDGPLHITWSASRPVFRGDTAADLQDPAGAYTAGWEIGCEEGHIVLLPVKPPGAARDVELFGEPDQYDQDYENPPDLNRLRTLLEGSR